MWHVHGGFRSLMQQLPSVRARPVLPVLVPALVAIAMGVAGCASGRVGATDPLRDYDPGRPLVSGAVDFRAIYERMGLAASGPPIAFVADVGYFASRTPDSTLAVVGLSIPNRGLSFTHTTGGYAASYTVTLRIERDGVPVATQHDSEAVAVPTFKETGRTDESVIFTRTLALAPGPYTVSYDVRDVVGRREGSQRTSVTVPRLGRAPSLSTPVPVYEASARTTVDAPLKYLPAPRASLVFGVDDSAAVYLESYGGSAIVPMQLRTSAGATAWTGTVALEPHGSLASGTVRIPLDHADIGILTLTAGAGADTVTTPLFLGFGPDLPVLSFNEMLNYLRLFAVPERLRALRNATPADRGQLWSEFLRATDPNPSTPSNEALDDYFSRIREANQRFRADEGRGWLSDRGSVFVVLGEPAGMYDDYGYMYNAGDIMTRAGGSRVKIEVWQYPDFGQLVFYDPNDVGAWRLAPQSVSLFRSLLSRRLVH